MPEDCASQPQDVSFKLYLRRTPRINISYKDKHDLFESFKRKAAELNIPLRNIFWTDYDGEPVTMDNADDLMTAAKSCSQHLFVREEESSSSSCEEFVSDRHCGGRPRGLGRRGRSQSRGRRHRRHSSHRSRGHSRGRRSRSKSRGSSRGRSRSHSRSRSRSRDRFQRHRRHVPFCFTPWGPFHFPTTHHRYSCCTFSSNGFDRHDGRHGSHGN